MNFKWKYCKGCHTSYIECPKCGNNCCNAGTGYQDKNGNTVHFSQRDEEGVEPCSVCPQAYEIQQQGWDNHTDPWYYRFRSWCYNIYIHLRYEFYYRHKQ